MRNFEEVIEQFRSGELDVSRWNFCIYVEGFEFDAYIMGEGAEQCLARKVGFKSKKEIEDLYKSLGVKRILPI